MEGRQRGTFSINNPSWEKRREAKEHPGEYIVSSGCKKRGSNYEPQEWKRLGVPKEG